MRRNNNLADFLSRVAVFVIVIIAVVCVFGWYLPLIKENQSLRRQIAAKEERRDNLKAEINRMKLRRDGYQNNLRSLERLARERYGYANEKDTIFFFEAPPEQPRRPKTTR